MIRPKVCTARFERAAAIRVLTSYRDRSLRPILDSAWSPTERRGKQLLTLHRAVCTDYERVQESRHRHAWSHRARKSLFASDSVGSFCAEFDIPALSISQVSTLFRGHPGLIQGFNTFLPPGFRIECSVSTPSEGAVTTITVTTPMGMTTRTQVDAASSGSTLGSTAAAPTGTSRATASGSRPATTSVPPGRSPLGANPKSAAPSASTGSMHISTLPQPPAPGSMAASTPIATPGAASVLSSANATSNVATGPPATSSAATSAAPSPASVSVGAAPETAARPPMEFNHAINYVNKIKNRFAGDPETYRAFLEILQTYQRDGKQIQDVSIVEEMDQAHLDG